MSRYTIGQLKDGTRVLSLIRYATLFSDRTFIPGCGQELLDKLTPRILEEKIELESGVTAIYLIKHLDEDQKKIIDTLQTYADLVLLPRVILDALNTDSVERVTRFYKCVGQKFTENTVNLKMEQRVVDITCWMY